MSKISSLAKEEVNIKDFILRKLYIFLEKVVRYGKSPTMIFLNNNKSQNVHAWRLELWWLNCISISLTK
jgi:hypothetical protein